MTKNVSHPAARYPADGRKGERGRGAGWAFLLLAVVVAAAAFLFGETNREPGRTVFPLPAGHAGSYANDWGASREQGSHEGTDIFAPTGTPIYSITSGTVTRAYGSDEDGWNTLGGYTVMVEADRDSGPIRRGDRLYYAHMRAPTPLEPGEKVEAGQKVGEVGRTAGETKGARGDFPAHLHLGWYVGFGLLGEERDYETAPSGAINPYPLLRRIEQSGSENVDRLPAGRG